MILWLSKKTPHGTLLNLRALDSSATSAKLCGNYIITVGPDGLRVFDISVSPTKPKLLHSVTALPNIEIVDALIHNDTLYISYISRFSHRRYYGVVAALDLPSLPSHYTLQHDPDSPSVVLSERNAEFQLDLTGSTEVPIIANPILTYDLVYFITSRNRVFAFRHSDFLFYANIAGHFCYKGICALNAYSRDRHFIVLYDVNLRMERRNYFICDHSPRASVPLLTDGDDIGVIASTELTHDIGGHGIIIERGLLSVTSSYYAFVELKFQELSEPHISITAEVDPKDLHSVPKSYRIHTSSELVPGVSQNLENPIFIFR